MQPLPELHAWQRRVQHLRAAPPAQRLPCCAFQASPFVQPLSEPHAWQRRVLPGLSVPSEPHLRAGLVVFSCQPQPSLTLRTALGSAASQDVEREKDPLGPISRSTSALGPPLRGFSAFQPRFSAHPLAMVLVPLILLP